ncbi:hypothetical protein GCM10022204_30270 [Microlunatus aurantiacus]|uniref:Arabinogalactan endo-beta-1,4-galactanase n=1 Tax=Microlunatus aurantiacus TaxID=446786 RepID=A0ABP7DTD7_9ACTN
MSSRALWGLAGLLVGLLIAAGPAVAQPPPSNLCAGLTGDAYTRCLYAELDDRLRAVERPPAPTSTPRPSGSPSATPRPTPTVSVTVRPSVPPARSGVGAMVFTDRGNPTNTEKDIAALREAGATWIRMDIPKGAAGSVRGGRWQPDVGAMNFYDQAAEWADAAGLQIALVMADFDNDAAWTDDQHRGFLSQYTEHVASRLGDDVDLWQVYNEHDGRDYRTFAPTNATPTYLNRLRLTLEAARTGLRKHSSAPLTTTPFGYPVDDSRYDKWVTFFDGIGSSIDVIGVHAYPERSPVVISRVPQYIRQLRARYGKPVAVLEFGLPEVSGYGPPAEIGKAVVAQISAIMTADPFCATLYQLRDRGPTGSTDGEQVFGILRNDFTRKPYYGPVSAELKRWRDR